MPYVVVFVLRIHIRLTSSKGSYRYPSSRKNQRLNRSNLGDRETRKESKKWYREHSITIKQLNEIIRGLREKNRTIKMMLSRCLF